MPVSAHFLSIICGLNLCLSEEEVSECSEKCTVSLWYIHLFAQFVHTKYQNEYLSKARGPNTVDEYAACLMIRLSQKAYHLMTRTWMLTWTTPQMHKTCSRFYLLYIIWLWKHPCAPSQCLIESSNWSFWMKGLVVELSEKLCCPVLNESSVV